MPLATKVKFGLFLLLQAICLSLSGQSTENLSLTATYDEAPLPQILKELEARYGLTFSYLANTLEAKTVTHRFKNAGWQEITDFLFRRSGIEVKVLEGGYVVLTNLPDDARRPQDVCLQVIDESGAPLPFVTASINGKEQSFYSDTDGWCRRGVQAANTDSLQLDFIGYSSISVPVAAINNGKCLVQTMTTSGIDLTSVIVLEYLTDGIDATPEGREVRVKPNKIAAVPGFTETELYRSVQLLPGVNSSDETAGDLSIRGGTRDQTQVLWDGINIYAPGHYFGMISYFTPELVEDVRIWRGQADATYGGRLSGVVAMTTDREITNRPQGGASINLTHGSAYLKLPLLKNKSDLHLSARSSVNGLLGGPTYNSFRKQVFQRGNLSTGFIQVQSLDSLLSDEQSFNFTEYNGRWQWNPGKNTKITLSGFTQQDAFELEFDADEEAFFFNNISSLNNGISLTAKQQLSPAKSLSLQSTFTKQGNSSEEGFNFLFGEFSFLRESSITDASVRLDYEQTLTRQHTLKLGLQAQQMESILFFGQNNGIDTLIFAEQTGQESLSLIGYGAFTWRPNSATQADIGLRTVYYEPTGELYPEPRFTASYRLNKAWTLKAGFGINHQFFNEIVELDEDDFSVTTPLWALADDDDFSVPKAKELTLGVLWKQKGWLLDIEAYNKQISNLSSVNLTNLFDEEDEFDRLASGESRSLGVDFLLKKRYQNFTSWGIYTISKSDWFFPESIGTSETFFPAQNDVRHRFKWVTAFQTERWLLSLGWQFNSGARFTPSTQEIDFSTEEIITLREDLNSGQLPSFHRLDLSAFYQWGKTGNTPGLRGKVGLSLLNLYGRENTLGAGLSESFDDFESDDTLIFRNGLGFTPNLTLSIAWQ